MKKMRKKQCLVLALAVTIIAGLIFLVTHHNAKKRETASVDAISSELYRELYQLKNTHLRDKEDMEKICSLTCFYQENASIESRKQENTDAYTGYVFRLKKKPLFEVQTSELKQQASLLLALVPELSYVKYEMLGTPYVLFRQYGETSGASEIKVANDDVMKEHTKDASAFQAFMETIQPAYTSQSIDGVVGKHLYNRAIQKIGDEECVVESHLIVNATEKNGVIEVYALTSIGNFRFINGKLVRLDEIFIRPAIYTILRNQNKQYEFVHADFHPAGATTEDAIRQIFIVKTAENVIGNLSMFKDNMIAQEKEAAKKYAESIGRDVPIACMDELELSYLEEGIPESTMNKIIADVKLIRYPIWVGNQEFIEGGVRYVYETAYQKGNNTIRFKKYEYDSKNITEELKVSAETGDYVG